MSEFLKFIMTKKFSFILITLLAISISYIINSNKIVNYYYDIGIYTKPIVIFNDNGIAKEIVFSYDSIFATRAFYEEHNRTRLLGSYPKLIKKDNDTIRVITEYHDSYKYGKSLLEKIYTESLDRIKYYHDANLIFKKASEKKLYLQVQSSTFEKSKIFSYHFSPINKTSMDDSLVTILIVLLSLGIYIFYLLINFANIKSN